MREGTELKYTHQDHLSSTSVMTDESGDSLGVIKYLPFGQTRSGSVPTDKQFTGQTLDSTGLYYYNARYYDPEIGRFLSPDSITHSEALPYGKVIKGLTVYRTTSQFLVEQIRNPHYIDPQGHNRYSYCLNNPYKYTDPDGHQVQVIPVVVIDLAIAYGYLCLLYGFEEANNIMGDALKSIGDAISSIAGAIGSFFTDPHGDDDDPDDIKNHPDYNDPNKAHHMLGNKDKNWQPLLDKFNGDTIKAYQAVLKATQQHLTQNPFILLNDGIQKMVVNVRGVDVTVRIFKNIGGWRLSSMWP